MKKAIIIISLLMLVLCFTLTACNEPPALTAPTEEQKAFYANWQSHIMDDARITKVAMIGSHDSGISVTTSPLKDMTKTQDLTIGEQLAYGCRYFDIRVHKKSNDELTIFHSVDKSGEKFVDIAADLLKFIKANSSEFLVLDFQHFSGDSQPAVIEAINSTGLIDHAVSNTGEMSDLDFIDSLRVSDVRGKFIIIWGSNEANDGKYPYLFRRNNDSCTIENAVLDSLYNTADNTKPSAEFIAETIPKYFAHIIKKQKGLTVLQAQLTSPSLGNLQKLEHSHNQNMSKFIRSIEQNAEQLAAVNIIMRDFIGSDAEKSNSILHINLAKNIVKQSSVQKFEQLTKQAA